MSFRFPKNYFFFGNGYRYTHASTKCKNEKLNSASLNVTLIENQFEFIKLKDQWNELLNKTVEPHPFLSWEWQYTWWENFANENDQLLILCVHSGSELVGIAPFYIKRKALCNVLKSIGEGEAKKEAIITHYQDILTEDHNSIHVMTALAKYMNANKQWNYAEFNFVLDSAHLHTLIENLKPLLLFKYSLGHRYILDLKRSFDELYSSLGKSSKKSFRSKKNRLKKEGKLSLESLDVTDNIVESLDTHAFFHTHRQQALGRKGNFIQPNFKNFHASLIKRLKGTGKVDIRVLNLDDSPIACSLNYLSNNTENPTVYSYSSGYKSKDDARLSPMFVFDMLEFESLIDRDIAFYDFLSSTDAVSYKDTYRCDTQAVAGVRWFEMTFIGVSAYALIRVRKFLSPVKADFKTMMKKVIKKINKAKLKPSNHLKVFSLIITGKLISVCDSYLVTLTSIT